jgi:hypothetical protein
MTLKIRSIAAKSCAPDPLVATYLLYLGLLRIARAAADQAKTLQLAAVDEYSAFQVASSLRH